MSARRATVVLKPAAQRDVRSILLYSGQQWRPAQRDAAAGELNRAFATLGEHPGIGRIRDDIDPGIRSFGALQHHIYDRVSGDTVTSIRILHRKMDPSQRVE